MTPAEDTETYVRQQIAKSIGKSVEGLDRLKEDLLATNSEELPEKLLTTLADQYAMLAENVIRARLLTTIGRISSEKGGEE